MINSSIPAPGLPRIVADALPARCIYTIDLNTNLNILSNLVTKFKGTLLETPKPYSSFISGNDHLIALYLSGDGPSNTSFYSTSAFFANISSSLTTYVRQNGRSKLNELARGTVSVGTTCVQVQWGWVAYAVMTTLLLLVFFGAMIVQTKGAQVSPYHDFKSSALTLLYHGLEGESLKETGGAGKSNSEYKLEEMAKGVAVQLVHTDMGWKMKIVRKNGGEMGPECYNNY
jgi:hypothetical protein